MYGEIITAIKPELLIMMPVLYTIAELIKKTKVKTWKIPFILWGVSILLTFLYLLTVYTFVQCIYTGIVQGTFLAMATVGSNQFYKQATEKRLIKTEKEPDAIPKINNDSGDKK